MCYLCYNSNIISWGGVIMIFTNWGLEVEILGGNMECGTVRVKYKDGSFKDKLIAELKADDGLNEIERAINQANVKIKQGSY